MDWNDVKAMVEGRGDLDCKPKQIWWAYFGENIGEEQYGKGKMFLRPVLIIKRFSQGLCFVVPLTTKKKPNPCHLTISWKKKDGKYKTDYLLFDQARTISTKRLIKVIGDIKFHQLQKLCKYFYKILISE